MKTQYKIPEKILTKDYVVQEETYFFSEMALSQAIDKLKGLQEQVPEQFKDSAVIDIHIYDSSDYYDSYKQAAVSVWYMRPETDKESKLRIDAEVKKLKRFEEADLKKYKELKKRFGDLEIPNNE